MNIREATSQDFDQIWPIFQGIVTASETYTYPRDTTSNRPSNFGWKHLCRRRKWQNPGHLLHQNQPAGWWGSCLQLRLYGVCCRA